jgi:peroxiredoxin
MKYALLVTAMAVALTSGAAQAALSVGAKAPDFTAQATLGGKEFSFSMAEALKKGPVVLYFYPAAFTSGCTVEAHEFADAVEKFSAMGATVIGVSHDDVATLDKFSVSECRSKFPVAADPDLKVIQAYDARMTWPLTYSNRTSYVIAPDHTVLLAYTDLNPDQHVTRTLEAVQKWHDRHQ